MRKKPNPFVSISDLMAGVTAVVMLLLVVTVVKMSVMADAAEKRKKQGVEQAIKEIRKSINPSLNSVVVTDSVITLRSNAFEQGSACLNPSVKKALKQIAPILAKKMKDFPNISVQFEGHTDAASVMGISTDVSKNCAVYDDNYSLSAGRAREARKALLNTVKGDKSISRRISVVGYGPDHLKNPHNPRADENRRVEIRLVARDAF